MIQKALIKLQAIKSGFINGTGGAELHGLYFAAVQSIAPSLAELWHRDTDKPFVIGSLAGEMNMRQGKWQIEKEKNYSFSLATLDQCAYEVMPHILTLWGNQQIRIGTAEFAVQEVKFVVPNGLTYQDILDRAREAKKFELEFVSPTTFRSDGRYLLFPEPVQIYRSLIGTWKKFNEFPGGECSIDGVDIIHYKLHTVLEKFDRYEVPGFLGSCRYQIKDNPELARVIGILGYYAGFAGVGYKRTMGLGQVRFRTL